MNTYQISIQRENGTTCTDRVVAATPAEAKKLFREIYRHGEAFQSKDLKVELVSENVPASKDQERKALEQIKAIVESLGPNSYIGTAFEGCFEIADENIEDDFACSMKRRCEGLEHENGSLRNQVIELQKKIKAMELDNRDLRLAIKKEKESSSIKETALQERVLSDDDLTDCIALVKEKIYEYEEAMNEASKDIVELAEDPTSQDFLQAVRDHRIAKSALEYMQAMMARLQKAAHQ